MPSPITRFKCDFCKRHYSTKYGAMRHEKECLYNPTNKSCSTCGNRTDDWCDLKLKEIFVKYQPIRDCADWTEITIDEDYPDLPDYWD